METECGAYKQPVGVHLEDRRRMLGKVIPTTEGAHDRLKTYERLTIVYDIETLVAYISRKCVPAGVEITNREYWQPMNVSGYADDNIIIISDRNVSGQLVPYTLETVLPTVAEVSRNQGAILSFFSLEDGAHWEIWQFFGLDVSDWTDTSQWRSVYNAWSKFAGWYDTVDQLYQLHVGEINGKYALVGPTIKETVIYQGTTGGWLPLDINIYQKMLNDLLYLVDEGDVHVTDIQRESLNKLINGCDAPRMFTVFNVKVAVPSTYGDLEIHYPKGPFNDCGVIQNLATGVLSRLVVNSTDIEDLDITFYSGTWMDVMNNGTVYSTANKSDMGFMRVVFENDPGNTLVVQVDGVEMPYTNTFKVPCDGGTHTIIITEAE